MMATTTRPACGLVVDDLLALAQRAAMTGDAYARDVVLAEARAQIRAAVRRGTLSLRAAAVLEIELARIARAS